MMKRIFLIVLDGVGIGEASDAADYGDAGSHTLRTCWNTGKLAVPNLQKLGLFNIEGVGCGCPAANPIGAFARMQEASAGKDTTIGHWEIAGFISDRPLPTLSNGFPTELLDEFERRTGRGVLCNKLCSGARALYDFGRRHVGTGDLIVYTSADSVFQVAAHESMVPVEQLYEYCATARKLLTGVYGVERVIASPFIGAFPDYTRTPHQRDFSLEPPVPTMLDGILSAGFSVIGVGKINDIFSGQGITESIRTSSNMDGMDKTASYMRQEFEGLCFTNLADFDMLYGHRNNIAGYADALCRFDARLGEVMQLMRNGDVLMITADHGCDPGMASTGHTREYTPLLIYGDGVRPGVDLGTRRTFADISATAAELLGIRMQTDGTSLVPHILMQ